MMLNFMVSATSIVVNATMIKKIYFSRKHIVLAQILSSFVVMLIDYVIILDTIVISGFGISPEIELVLLIPVHMLFFVLVYAFLFSVLTLYIGDIQHFMPSIGMTFFFMTPVYFTLDSVSGILKTIVCFNPFTYCVEMLHQLVFCSNLPELIVFIGCILLFIISIATCFNVFMKLKKGFAERLLRN